MTIVLFDIDGTLTHSQSIDSDLYLHSLESVFGFKGVGSDWSAYRHTSDSGILDEIFEMRLGRAPLQQEAAAFRAHFVAAVAAEAARQPFREIPGARRILDRLESEASWHIGLATGGFGESARLKMMSAGLDFDRYPSASADDARSRTGIMEIAIERVRAQSQAHAATSAGRVVYIGDGIWDARACRELRIPFIGIAEREAAETLAREGAAAVFPDYRDTAAFCAAVSAATTPG